MDAFRDWTWRNGSRKEGIDDEVVVELAMAMVGIGWDSRSKSRGGIGGA